MTSDSEPSSEIPNGDAPTRRPRPLDQSLTDTARAHDALVESRPVAAGEADDVASWEQIAEHVERLINAWEGGELPDLADFLPTDRSRRDVLIELVKVDLDYRTQFGLQTRVEDYAEQFPELAAAGIPADLVFEEYHIRQAAGDEIDPAEYFDRFPGHRSALEPLLGMNDVDDPASSDPPNHAAFDAGDQLADFLVLSKLGHGAFASVYLAQQQSMQRLVALKVSAEKGTEAQTLAQLDHPHIVRVYDQSRLPEQRLRLLYMQLAPGGTLHSVIKASKETTVKTGAVVRDVVVEAIGRTGVFPPEDVFIKRTLLDQRWPVVCCHYGVELASALQYAHDQGVLHRDVKPANVLLDANGSCKLADFNISFAAEVEGTDAASSFGGSLAYMSPEQLEACHPGLPRKPDELDARSDVYALGVVLWELLVGQRPYQDDTVGNDWNATVEAMIERRRGRPQNTLTSDDPIAAALLDVLTRAMAFDRADRFPTAAALADAVLLCYQPRVAHLLGRQSRDWIPWAIRYPTVAVVLATILPNVPAAMFAFHYNKASIVAAMEDAQAQAVFGWVQFVINGLAFPIAIALLIFHARPLKRWMSDRSSRSPQAKRRVLRLGFFGAVLGIVEWSIAAVLYPTALSSTLDSMTLAECGHFFWSHIICGMIAAAYPFFLLTALGVRALFPRLLRQGETLNDADADELTRVSDRMSWFLFIAGGVPAAGILALLLIVDAGEAQHTLTLKILSLLGAVGFALVFWLYRGLQADIDALQETVRIKRELMPSWAQATSNSTKIRIPVAPVE